MRDSNYSDVNSIQLSDDNSSKKDIEDSIVIEKQTQTIQKFDDVEINLSNANNSKFSIISSTNMQNDNNNKNSKIVKTENKSNINDDNLNSNKSRILHFGNRLNELNIENTLNQIELHEDKEKSKHKGYIVYEISRIENNKKKILCYRRYDNFSKFYEVLKIRYPHYIFPKLSPKKITVKIKVIDEQEFLEKRRYELQFFINEIYNHKDIKKGEEIKKFLYGGNFDKQYFNSIQKCFDYPETTKKINANKGLISKGVKSVSSLYNYFIGYKDKNNIERENSVKIFKIKEKLEKKIEKYNLTYEEIKKIYKVLQDENKEKNYISNNLLFLKSDKNNEKDNDNEKKKFNELIEMHQRYDSKKNELFLHNFEQEIVYKLDYCLLYLKGEEKAINRYKNFLEKYKEIINYTKGPKDDDRIDYEQSCIKKDIEKYENNLLKEMGEIEEKMNKKFEDIIHALIIHLKTMAEESVELFKENDLIKDMKEEE